MRYGYVTGFATVIKDRIDYDLLQSSKDAGYDFVEFPLMLLASLPKDEVERAADVLRSLQLGADSCCNMFPASQRITGPKRDWSAAQHYLDGAFEHMALLGTRKLVFGSTGARNLPAGTTQEEGFDQVSEFISQIVVPYLKEYDIVLCMEPIGAYEANFLITLADGMRVVHQVQHEKVRLLADSVHMLYGKEDPEYLRKYAPYLEHVHLCENERALPLGKTSPELAAILAMLKDIGYNKTVSFEPVPYGVSDMKLALETIKKILDS